MREISLYGLGGQGIVTLTNILAEAAFRAGQKVQAFPLFGPERTGAPVTGFLRLDQKPIIIRQQITKPDIVIIIDDRLLTAHRSYVKLDPAKSRLLINSRQDKKMLSTLLGVPVKLIQICQPPADLGQAANLFVAGTIIKTYGLANLNNLRLAIRQQLADKTPAVIEKNLQAARLGYETPTT